jgi:hypothetical protein
MRRRTKKAIVSVLAAAGLAGGVPRPDEWWPAGRGAPVGQALTDEAPLSSKPDEAPLSG